MLRLITLFALSVLLTNCGSDANNEAPAAGTDTPAITTSGGQSCLADIEGSLCDWLPVDLINDYFPGEGEVRGYKENERKSLSSCGISYDDPTNMVTMTAGTMTMQVPANYNVALIGPRRYTGSGSALNNFKSIYRTPTAEEMERGRQAAQDALKKQLDDGKIDQQTYDMAQEMKGNFLGGKGPQYEQLEGLGDAAVWGKVTQNGPASSGDLFVLHKDVTFNLTVDAVESYEKSRELAIMVAREIIGLCD